MKGIMLNIKKPNIQTISKEDIKYFIKHFGVVTFLGLTLIVGMIYGSVIARYANTELLDNLDFLFISNFKLRLSQGLINTFSASLASYFIFWFANFLLGLTAWGTIAIPVVTFIKGIGIGLSAGYLYSTYGANGIYFYLSVMLLGAFVSSIALIKAGKEAFYFSKKLGLKLLPKYKDTKQISIIKYSVNSGYALIITAISAGIDTLMALFFSGFFSF